MGKLPAPLKEHPFETLIGFLCVETGPSMMFGLAPNSALAVLAPWLIRVWGLSLTLGGVLVLTGIGLRYFRDRFETGLMVERAGYLPLSTGALVFAFVIAAYAGIKGVAAIATYVVFAAVCALRFQSITETLSRIRRLERGDLK